MNNPADPQAGHGDLPSDYTPRHSERSRLDVPTRLTQQNRSSVEIVLVDISSSGFMAACQANVPIGSYVAIDLPGLGLRRAQVRWQIGGRLGAAFLDPVRLSRCDWTAPQVR